MCLLSHTKRKSFWVSPIPFDRYNLQVKVMANGITLLYIQLLKNNHAIVKKLFLHTSKVLNNKKHEDKVRFLSFLFGFCSLLLRFNYFLLYMDMKTKTNILNAFVPLHFYDIISIVSFL